MVVGGNGDIAGGAGLANGGAVLGLAYMLWLPCQQTLVPSEHLRTCVSRVWGRCLAWT